MTVQDVKEVFVSALPFAAPLRAIEQISIDHSGDKLRLRATKVIDATDPYMAGHFPDFTIFPGIFIIESLQQAVASAFDQSGEMWPELLTLRSARFMAPLLPGDCMTLHATIGPMSEGNSFAVEAHCERGDGVTVAQMKAEFQLVS
jgi:3-hydroxyacyl-[acyl-carrier-protein] dehydratase